MVEDKNNIEVATGLSHLANGLMAEDYPKWKDLIAKPGITASGMGKVLNGDSQEAVLEVERNAVVGILEWAAGKVGMALVDMTVNQPVHLDNQTAVEVK